MAGQGRTIGNNLKTLFFGIKLKKRKGKKKNKAGSTLILARWKPTRAVCSGWSYPIQAKLTLVLGGVPPVAQVRRMDDEVGSSLVCIDSVLSLAVVSTALQKLHKCVTQNTTELLQDTEDKMFWTTARLENRSLASPCRTFLFSDLCLYH